MAESQIRQQMSAAQFAAKFKSKRECHRFLAVEVGAYIPPLSTVTIYHMRDLIAGQKRVSATLSEILTILFVFQIIYGEGVKHFSVPLYETLKVVEMLKFAQRWQEVGEFFPSVKEVMKWPRQYTINCLVIILGPRFTEWVDMRIEELADGYAWTNFKSVLECSA